MTATFADPNAIPPPNDRASAGRTNQARDAKRRKIVQMLDAQAVFHRDMLNEKLPPYQRASAATAYINLEDRIRILKGKPLPGVLKPGDRMARVLPPDRRRPMRNLVVDVTPTETTEPQPPPIEPVNLPTVPVSGVSVIDSAPKQ